MSMNDGPTTAGGYPEGTKVTRIPLYINSFPSVGNQIVAKVKQPSVKPTPISQTLEITPPVINSTDRDRYRKLERNDNARSIWTLLDHEQKVQYNGPAEPSDPNNRYFLLYTNHNDGNAHVLPITQVNLQKANTSVRFKTIEEVEAYQKSRIKLAKAFKPEDLGLDFDIASVTQSIKNDRLKKSKKGGSNGAKSSSSKRSNGGIEEGDDIDYDDAEDVWEVNDDDEGIQNKDLVDFEDTGDWQGGKKSEYVLGEGDVDLGDEQNDTTLQDVYFQKDENNDDEGSSGDEDNTMGDGPSSISANGLFGQGGTKRKTLNEVNYASEEGNVGVQKRQKPPVKKK